MTREYTPDRYTLEELLPQSGNMILLDRVRHVDDQTISTELQVRDDRLFSLANGRVPGWVGIEYMAQTIAAYSGYHCRCRGDAIQVGLLLGTRQYSSEAAFFACGTSLIVNASKIIQGSNEMAVFGCTIETVKSDVVASANLNVLLPRDDTVYLAKAAVNAKARHE